MNKLKPITTSDSNYEFIELNRTFTELSNLSSENDDLDINHIFSADEPLRWSNLINEYRLIILSEAGSGKTTEIRNITRTLREQGKSAFFLRLERIPRDFEEAFEVGTFEAFQEWLATSDEGWLLLDSIDEARLRSPSDFELAIHKLSRRISTAKDRTHIVITGRTTAWRPHTDLVRCTSLLPYAVKTTSESDQQVEENDFGESIQTKTETPSRAKPVFKIVSLDNLTRNQIAVFVKFRGIEHSEDFLDALERADAWWFTSRPQDLEELIEFWLDKGRIGTRLEIMQNSIDRRLSERDQSRAYAHPLSAERARQGSRLLAGTTTLAKNPTIRIPDGAENSKGIAVQSVLPDWDDKDQSTLLLRPIFDEAIYGEVRFHHRSVREYLTAEWFAELLNRETSRRNIETLFFRNQYGLDIVVPTLRPILPWLAILDEKIRERVLKVAPEIIFEGGDPSQLPLKVRRYILHEVCEQMAAGATGRSMRDYEAVQRFADSDLTDDVRALIRKYADNEDLTAFLLRMVWIGQLAGALPETMEVALKPTAEWYTRIAAFRAIKAISSYDDQERVRQSFLDEASDLKREWLTELIKGIQPTEKTLVWLLACVEKSESKERYTVDHLTDGITEFVNTADIDLLPKIVTRLNYLLGISPVIECRHCKVSKKFEWLMEPALYAVERLIFARHPASLEPDALAILHKFSAVRAYGSSELAEDNHEFSKHIPAWKELNRVLFWFEIQRSRESLDKKHGERLTNFWRASNFGPFWRFEEYDFEYVAKEISHQTLLDDKLVALSLAFTLYEAASRPSAWLKQLKKLVLANDELSARLGTYLKPPAQSQDSRRWKKREAKWKSRDEANRRKQEKYHVGWKKYFKDNIEEAREAHRNKPGTLTNSLQYLFTRTRDEKSTTLRWTQYNWKSLILEYGEDVARFYRDSTVSYWRHYEPKLRSEGASPNQTTYAVIIGLTGLEIEATETKDWPKNLSTAEVERACRYASFELNGFPTWFPKLFEKHPRIVCDFLIQEVRYELSIENPKTETHYIISDVSWSGQWAWDQLAPDIYDLLKREPKSLSNLANLLKILQGSTIADDFIEKLASRKCRTLKALNHVTRWFAVWVGIAPDTAIVSLKARIGKIKVSKDQTMFAMTFVTHLFGGHRGDGTAMRQAFKTHEYLKSLYLLMHKYIRPEDDINRAGSGVYSPGLRDDAQNARDGLFQLLNQIPGKESYLALMDIAKLHPEKTSRPWILLQAKTRAELDGDIEPWSPSQVRSFNDKLERTPTNHMELAELAILRFRDLKDDLEHGDRSNASILQTVTHETEMRKYLGKELSDKAFHRYSIPQEEELADAKKPDMRFRGKGFDQPVPVELKLADNWSGPKLFERLENQLCGDYLRDNRSRRGIFVLVYRGKKHKWVLPGSGNRVDFVELTTALQDLWPRISPKFPNVDDISVIGIDLTKRAS